MAEHQDQQQHPVLLGKTNAAELNQYYFHERMVSQLQSKVLFLRSQLKSKENYFLEEINFLRQQLESASNSVRCDEASFLSWRDKVNLQTQDLENRSCKNPHRNNINKSIQLDNIVNNEKLPLLKENDTSLDPNDIDFNISITEHNKSTSNETRKVNASVINGNVRNYKSTTRKNDTKDKEIVDKAVSNNNHESKSVKKKVFILGNSIIKHVKSYSLSKSLGNCKVYVKDFPGARVRCMQDYVRPTIRENPDHVIIHVGTNDLTTNIPTEKVTESIINLASSLKSNSFNVAIFSITVRNDRYRKKVAQVNRHLKTLCIELISHENVITEKHLNRSKLHLNKRGTATLSNTFTEAISKSIY